MRSLLNKSIVLVLLFFTAKSFAGNEVGNGGNAVVCKTSVQLLDFYEAKVLRSVVPDPKITGSDPYEIVKARLKLLEKIDPKSAKIFGSNLERLRQDVSFEDDISIRAIDDSAHAFVPKDPDCEVKQLAVLRKKPLPGEKRILVNNVIWKKMAPVQQAGLLLHEIIYEHLAFLGETDSAKARFLVTYLM